MKETRGAQQNKVAEARAHAAAIGRLGQHTVTPEVSHSLPPIRKAANAVAVESMPTVVEDASPTPPPAPPPGPPPSQPGLSRPGAVHHAHLTGDR